MLTVLLVAHVIITVALIAIVLVQRSDSDGLSGIGGGAGGGGGVISTRAAANALTRATAILATLFMLNALAMGAIVARTHNQNGGGSIVDHMDGKTQAAPAGQAAEKTAAEKPTVPTAKTDDAPKQPVKKAPAAPSVPVAQ